MLVPRSETFAVITLPQPCMQAACGSNHTLALCRSAPASAPGDSSGLGPGISPRSPALDLSAGHTVLYGFGANNNGQITSGEAGSMFRTPHVLPTIAASYNTSRIICIAAGGDQSFAIGFAGALEAGMTPTAVPGGLLRKQFSTLTSKATVAMSAAALLSLLTDAKSAMTGADGRAISAHADSHQVVTALNTASELFSTPSLLAGSFECATSSEQAAQQREVASAALRAVQYHLLQAHKPTEYPALSSLVSNPEFDHTNVYAHKAAAVRQDLAEIKVPPGEQLAKLPLLDIAGIEKCYVTLMQLGSTATARLLAAVQQSVTELEHATQAIAPGDALPDSALRVIMILWQAPIMAVPTLSNQILTRLLRIAQPLRRKLQILCAMYPAHLFVARLLKPLHAHLAHAMQFDNQHVLETNGTPLICEALSWLYEVNTVYKLAPPEAFNNEKIASLPDTTLVSDCFIWRKFCETESKAETKSTTPPFLVCRYSFLLSVETKKKLLLIEDTILMQHYQQEALRLAVMTGATTVQPYFVLPIERAHLLQHALVHISNASPLDLRKPLKVLFIGEEGIDEGGVKKEFFQLLITQLFSIQYGMFIPAPSGRCSVVNMCNTYADAEFRLVGVLLGLAVYNNVLLDVHFPLALYKLLLDQNVTLEDLLPVDPELYNGLQQLLRFEPADQVEDVFCRYFATEWDEFGAKREHDLIPDGRNIAVTGENRFLYVDRLVQWILKDSIATQFTALKEGFGSVIGKESLMLLTADELQLVMVGTPHLDFKELQLTTEYVGPETWNSENPTIRKFWAIVHSLSFEEKQKFLLFVTGSSKAPLGGLKNIRLRIQRMGPHSNLLPTAHTCFNTLLLPEYDCDGTNPPIQEPASTGDASSAMVTDSTAASATRAPNASASSASGATASTAAENASSAAMDTDNTDQPATGDSEDSAASAVAAATTTASDTAGAATLPDTTQPSRGEAFNAAAAPASQTAMSVAAEVGEPMEFPQNDSAAAPAAPSGVPLTEAQQLPAQDSTAAAIAATAPPPAAPKPPMPNMSTEEFIRDRLLIAISECEGFGLK
jgi:hypothetical protein